MILYYTILYIYIYIYIYIHNFLYLFSLPLCTYIVAFSRLLPCPEPIPSAHLLVVCCGLGGDLQETLYIHIYIYIYMILTIYIFPPKPQLISYIHTYIHIHIYIYMPVSILFPFPIPSSKVSFGSGPYLKSPTAAPTALLERPLTYFEI